jgi:hypothetical protein
MEIAVVIGRKIEINGRTKLHKKFAETEIGKGKLQPLILEV